MTRRIRVGNGADPWWPNKKRARRVGLPFALPHPARAAAAVANAGRPADGLSQHPPTLAVLTRRVVHRQRRADALHERVTPAPPTTLACRAGRRPRPQTPRQARQGVVGGVPSHEHGGRPARSWLWTRATSNRRRAAARQTSRSVFGAGFGGISDMGAPEWAREMGRRREASMPGVLRVTASR